MVNGPFVLLDDARTSPAAPARLYVKPIEIIIAHHLEDVERALNEMAAAQARGLHAAGYIGFGAAAAFETRLTRAQITSSNTTTDAPLLWFGLFEHYQEIAPDDVAKLFPPANTAWVGSPRPHMSRTDYGHAIARIKAYIAAGDIYQANFTFPSTVLFQGDPLAIYAGLRTRAAAGYGGIIYTGSDWLLSLSPELFFALEGRKLTTKPMKGTAARDGKDSAAADMLQSDPKQRAENLMIVDLLRNDLSRVAVAGSVQVPQLFEVETYPTVHQMTSTITAQLRTGLTAFDVLRSMFPCGSVVGAPKIRALEIIAEVETKARDAYTGSMGRIDGNGDAAFNVAIRTLTFRDGAGVETMGQATIGLGSGIVADSDVEAEWKECLDKGAFVPSPINFDLIETMRFDPDGGITLLEGHLARLDASAQQFGFAFSRHEARNALQAATIRQKGVRKLRLLLSKSGAVSISLGALPPLPLSVVKCLVVPLPVNPADVRLRHKTSDRAFYDDARHEAQRNHNIFEVLFIDPQGFLTEGSFTNIFVRKAGKLITPRANRGLLSGVFRAALLANGDAEEADVTPVDLRDGFFIGNALRGLIAAKLGVSA